MQDRDDAVEDCWVVCVEYVVGPFSRGAANARLVDIAASSPFGPGCPRDHHIVQSATEPEPSYPPAGPNPLPATS